MKEIESILKKHKKTMGLKGKKCLPSTEYLLIILATIEPSHRYFSKSFKPTQAELGMQEE